jgi:hypothetical protein
MIGLITACDHKLKSLSDLTVPILQTYCDNHHYCFINKTINNFDKPPSWYKIYAILEQLNNLKYEYLLWLDTDTIILKPDFKIESLISSNKDLYISRDINGINCGVFLVKNSNIIKSILYATLHLSEKYLNHVWWEQAAIMELMDNNFLNIENTTEFIPQRILNAYDPLYTKTNDDGYVDSDTFILHLPAVDNYLRHTIISNYRNKYYGF